MTYPLSLAYGIISVYKLKARSEYHNIKAPQNYNWATVYQIADYGITRGTALGQIVMFDGREIMCQLAISSVTYSLLPEVKIVTIENDN